MDFNCLTAAQLDGIKYRVSRASEKVEGNGTSSSPTGQSSPSRSDITVPENATLLFGAGRLRSVAILFLDIPGFSGRPSSDAKAQGRLMRAINLFFSEVVRIIEEYGGTVAKNAADGLVAFFDNADGVSATQRAVACALTLSHANTEAISPSVLKLQVEPFTFRIGIDYGTMTLARPDTSQRFTPMLAIGATAAAAQQMLTSAKAGEILLGNQAFFDLPLSWQTNCVAVEGETGWVWNGTEYPYHFYRYTCRWRVQR